MIEVRLESSEMQTLQAILDYLAARRILGFRMNTGAMMQEHGGRQRIVRFGVPGMADIVCFPSVRVLWIEVKARAGKQSPYQRSFQEQVERAGHRYLLARSIEDVETVLVEMEDD